MCLAVPGRIERIDVGAALPTAQVSFGGVRKQVNLGYVPDAAVGDYVLVHVGIAIAVVDPAEAARTLALLDELTAPEDET